MKVLIVKYKARYYKSVIYLIHYINPIHPRKYFHHSNNVYFTKNIKNIL